MPDLKGFESASVGVSIGARVHSIADSMLEVRGTRHGTKREPIIYERREHRSRGTAG